MELLREKDYYKQVPKRKQREIIAEVGKVNPAMICTDYEMEFNSLSNIQKSVLDLFENTHDIDYVIDVTGVTKAYAVNLILTMSRKHKEYTEYTEILSNLNKDNIDIAPATFIKLEHRFFCRLRLSKDATIRDFKWLIVRMFLKGLEVMILEPTPEGKFKATKPYGIGAGTYLESVTALNNLSTDYGLEEKWQVHYNEIDVRKDDMFKLLSSVYK